MKFIASALCAALLGTVAAAQNQAVGLTTGTNGYVLVTANPTLAPAQITIEAWVFFGAPALNTTFTPTLPAALTGYPFLGAWCDLNPATGGSITISTPSPGLVRIAYTAVPYYGTTILNTFAILLDGVSGVVSIDGIPGIAAGAATQFLGMSPGILGPATDPGLAPFAVGGPFLPPANTDMIYRLGTAGSLAPGVTRLDFLPTGNNYAWLGS